MKFHENPAGGSGSDRDKKDETNYRVTHLLRVGCQFQHLVASVIA